MILGFVQTKKEAEIFLCFFFYFLCLVRKACPVFQQLSERQRLSEQCECNEYLFFCSGRLFGLELSEQSEPKQRTAQMCCPFLLIVGMNG